MIIIQRPESSLIESQVRCPHYHSLIYTYVLYLYIYNNKNPKHSAFKLRIQEWCYIKSLNHQKEEIAIS